MADAALAASLFHYKELEIKEVKRLPKKEGVLFVCDTCLLLLSFIAQPETSAAV